MTERSDAILERKKEEVEGLRRAHHDALDFVFGQFGAENDVVVQESIDQGQMSGLEKGTPPFERAKVTLKATGMASVSSKLLLSVRVNGTESTEGVLDGVVSGLLDEHIAFARGISNVQKGISVPGAASRLLTFFHWTSEGVREGARRRLAELASGRKQG